MLRPHYPTPLTGLLLVFAATMLASLGVVMQIDPSKPTELPDVGGQGLAVTFAFGFVATLAARRVPAPRPERIGLQGVDSSFIGVLVALLPFVFLTSEIDNWLSYWFPPEGLEATRAALAEARANDTPLAIVQRSLFFVGLQPVVSTLLVQGVVLQGAIAYMGRLPGVLFTSVLGIGTLELMKGSTVASEMLLPFLGALVLCLVRVASGSLLAPILLLMGWNAIAIGATAAYETLPIAGFNQLDSFTSPLLLLVAVASVALAFTGVARGLGEQPVVLDIEEEPDPAEDEDGGGFF